MNKTADGLTVDVGYWVWFVTDDGSPTRTVEAATVIGVGSNGVASLVWTEFRNGSRQVIECKAIHELFCYKDAAEEEAKK